MIKLQATSRAGHGKPAPAYGSFLLNNQNTGIKTIARIM